MALSGRVALITGGAQGLGRAITDALLKNGARVCVVDNNEPVGRKCVEELGSKYGNGNLTFAACDVRKTEQLEAAFQKTTATFGRLDILGNNAGISGLEPSADDAMVVDINLRAVVEGNRLGMKYMGTGQGGEGGVIINTSSMAAFIPAAFLASYCATKSGVMMLTRCYGDPYIFKKHGVRVNCICPTFVKTPMIDKFMQDKGLLQVIEETGFVDIGLVADGFIQLAEDTTKNGAVMRITKQKGIDFYNFQGRTTVNSSKL